MASTKTKLLFLFALAFAARAFYMAQMPPRPAGWDDSVQWNKTAMRFYEGRGFLEDAADLDPKRPPLYPLFMAAVYRLSAPENFAQVKSVQVVLSALTVLGVFFLGRLIWGENVGFWGAALTALYPPLIVYSSILQSETLFILLLTAFLSLWFYWREDFTFKRASICGVLLGAVNLTRGTLFLFPLFLLAGIVLSPSMRAKAWPILWMVVLSLLCLSPWTWRNYKVYGQIIPVSTGGGEGLWSGTLPWAEQRLFGAGLQMQAIFKEMRESGLPPIQADNIFKERAIANIKAAPWDYAKLTLRKLWFFISQPVGANVLAARSHFLAYGLWAGHFTLLALFLCGLWLTRSQSEALFLPYLLLVYFVALHVVLAPEPRYRLPLEPLMILFAVQAVYKLRRG